MQRTFSRRKTMNATNQPLKSGSRAREVLARNFGQQSMQYLYLIRTPKYANSVKRFLKKMEAIRISTSRCCLSFSK